MRKILMAAFLFLGTGNCLAGWPKDGEPPERFFKYLPLLVVALDDVWPDISAPATVAGLIEQETCPTPTHVKCWNPHAELKTKHEHGIGLGQFTVTSRFNAFQETAPLHEKLKGWRPEDYYDPEKQLFALTVKLRQNYMAFIVPDDEERFAFALAAYNGGVGGILKDQRLCAKTEGCNPLKWWGNTENTSLKTKNPFNGFKKSAFQINREYPYNIMKLRRHKYEPFINQFFLGSD